MPTQSRAVAALRAAANAEVGSNERQRLVEAALANLQETVAHLRADLARGSNLRDVLSELRWTQWEPTFSQFDWTGEHLTEWTRITQALDALAEQALDR